MGLQVFDGMMISTTLTKLIERTAGRSLTLRGALVASNFVVMVGLAAGLGLERFGALIFFWSGALVAGTALSLGGPLILLRGLTDGCGMRMRDVVALVVAVPLILTLLVFLLMASLWPALPWFAILAAGFGVNVLTCLASVMRALGSLHWSMVLRDGAPQAALGFGAVLASGHAAAGILVAATCVMLLIGLIATVWCWRARHSTAVFSDHKRSLIDASLWGTSVLGMGIMQMDLIVGGMVLPAEALGVYALLRRIANLVALPVTVATWVSAAAISAAYGQGDMAALQKASRDGSRIALLPGAALFLMGLTAIPFILILLPGVTVVFVVLLVGALVQVLLASGFTVATLCGQARLSVLARLAALGCYLLSVQIIGGQLSPIINAVAYTVAMSCGSLLLWAQLKRKTGIETSAYALWRTRVGAWKAS